MGTKDKEKKAIKKNNARRYREKFRKDISDKRKNVKRKQREEVGDISYGSRVVKRSKTDVSRAPEYRPEKIKRSNFHSTFPSLQGVLDNEMQMKAMFERGLKRQKNQNEFKFLLEQGYAGNLELEQMTNEQKEELVKQKAILAKEQEKNKLQKELETVEKNINDERIRGLAYAEGHKRDLVVNDKKTGERKVKGRKAIQKKIEGKKLELEAYKQKTKEIQEFRATIDAHEKAKSDLDMENRRIHEILRHPSINPKEAVEIEEAIVKNNFDHLRLKKDLFNQENDKLQANIKHVHILRDRIKQYIDARNEIDILAKEIDAGYDKTGDRSKRLTTLLKTYGNSPELLEKRILAESQSLVNKCRDLKETEINLRYLLSETEEHEKTLPQRKAEVMRNANDAIAANPYTFDEVRKIARKRLLDYNEIKENLAILRQKTEQGIIAFCDEIDKVDELLTRDDHLMTDFDRDIRKKLKEIIKPVIDYYDRVDLDDLDRDEVEAEKRQTTFQMYDLMTNLTGFSPTDLLQRRMAEKQARGEPIDEEYDDY